MKLLEILFIAMGLSMDAAAVSLCASMSPAGKELANRLRISFSFGLFQGMMPVAGYFFGSLAGNILSSYGHWAAFSILLLIGLKMILGSSGDGNSCPGYFSFKSIIFLSLATSMDAMAAGISFAFIRVDIWIAAALIGATTFLVSFFAFASGRFLGEKFGEKAEIAGGTAIILIGFKILLENTVFR